MKDLPGLKNHILKVIAFFLHGKIHQILTHLPYIFEENDSNQSIEDWATNFQVASAKHFGKPHWFDRVGLEYASCREGIGLSDYSSFTKIDMWVSIQHSIE